MNILISTTDGLVQIASFIGTLIGSAGVMVIAVGALRGIYLFVYRVCNRKILLADIRIELGHYLGLGIEFLVAKDIIETMAAPTWDALGKLAALVVLRTVLTLFLGHEVKEVREELKFERLKKRKG